MAGMNWMDRVFFIDTLAMHWVLAFYISIIIYLFLLVFFLSI